MKLLSKLSALAAITLAVLVATPVQAKWGPWQSLDGKIVGEPSLVASSIGGTPILFIAGRGTDHALWWNQKVGNGKWAGWSSAGGILTSRPSCISRTPGIIDCFARGKDSTLAQRSYVNGAWNEWSFPGGSSNGPLLDLNYVATNAGSDRVTVLSGMGELGQLTWTPGNGWSKWAFANIPGWSPANGPFDCAQRTTGVNETYMAFGKQYTDVGFEQACVAKIGGQFTLFVTAKNGGAFPLPEIASKFMPDVAMTKTADGLRIYITYTNLKGAVEKRQFTVGKGWTKFADGAAVESLNGGLTSGPSCTAKHCAGRGLNGAVWIVAQQ